MARRSFLRSANVESAELWRQVGEYLLLRRLRMGFKNPIDVQRAGGPTYATIQKHERGEIASTASLDQHATALQLSSVDVLRAVLAADATQHPISAEQSRLVDRYDRMNPIGRAALLTMAEALAGAQPAIPTHRRQPQTAVVRHASVTLSATGDSTGTPPIFRYHPPAALSAAALRPRSPVRPARSSESTRRPTPPRSPSGHRTATP